MSKEIKPVVEELVRHLMVALGEDPHRPGLEKTPARTSAAYGKVLEGYGRSLKEEITTFDNDYGYSELVYSGGINFFSMCEHHILPFFGKAYIAYIPNDHIIGLSKMARATDIYSRRLQQQERLTTQIANELDGLLKPKGIIVLLEGKHMCNMARGVQQVNSTMITIARHGLFDDEKKYNQFMQLVELSKKQIDVSSGTTADTGN
ncbi:MAG TPA: GTP cyclohydrolase I FolE [Candidatus Saccharimonadales bacterium]|nr:GTP cyclohydrolase I FolE [Candidatus Saccharimonadales bacterium]